MELANHVQILLRDDADRDRAQFGVIDGFFGERETKTLSKMLIKKCTLLQFKKIARLGIRLSNARMQPC